MLGEFVPNRKPSAEELRLISFLIQTASIKISEEWMTQLVVLPMDDGGMGGFSLSPNNKGDGMRVFGRQISECSFVDSDGTKVVASLYVDQCDNLYELDIWKVDYSPLLKIPAKFPKEI